MVFHLTYLYGLLILKTNSIEDQEFHHPDLSSKFYILFISHLWTHFAFRVDCSISQEEVNDKST